MLYMCSWQEKCSFSRCRVRQEEARVGHRQTDKSDPLSPSLSNRRALQGVYGKGEKSTFFIRNHCHVWEPPLLLQKIHKPSGHLFINFQWQRFSVWGGNTRVPLFYQYNQPPLPPPTRVNSRLWVPRSFPEVSSGEFFQKEVLCIISLTAVWIALAAWWTREFLSCGSIKILPRLNDATGWGERAYYICQCHQFQESMANERGKFWNIRYGFLWPL